MKAASSKRWIALVAALLSLSFYSVGGVSVTAHAADSKTAPQAAASSTMGMPPTAQTAQGSSSSTPTDPAAGKHRKGWSFSEIRAMPIQSGGRMKPLDSFARSLVLFETGSTTYKGWDSVDLLFNWLSYPDYWQNQKFITIARADVRRQLNLQEKREYFSPAELFSNFPLLQYAQEAQRKGMGRPDLMTGKKDQRGESPREQELQNVFQRLELFRDIVSGEVWTIVPQTGGKAWLSIADKGLGHDLIRSHFIDVVKAYQAQDESSFEHSSMMLRAAVQGDVAGWTAHKAHQISAEVFYNRLHPFMYAWILYLLATLVWLLAPKRSTEMDEKLRRNWKSLAAGWLTFGGFAFHTLGIVLRCYIAGRPPVTNMYESIIWVSYGTVIFASILLWIQRNSTVLIVACAVATVGLIAANSAPAMMDPGLNPLMPVLRSNYWLTIHVLTITLSYSAFALTLGLGNAALWNYFKQDRARKVGDQKTVMQTQQKIAGLNLLTYRAMQFGIVLVAAGTILGGVWADYSWGRFWGWDPKEVWALVVTLTYVAIVHGRMTNWIRPFAFAVTAVLGFLSVLMAWYGVNFVLGVGLHSYGFGAGGSNYVIAFTVAQLIYVIAIAVHHKIATSTNTPSNGGGSTPVSAEPLTH